MRGLTRVVRLNRIRSAYRYDHCSTRIVAGAFCLVERGRIVRAAQINGRHGEAAVWEAGKGIVWSRKAQPGGLGSVLYAA